MRRLSFVIGSALLFAGGLSTLFAQHAGGHGAGSSGHVSSGAVHTHAAPSSTTVTTLSNRSPQPGQLIYPTPIGLQRQYSGFTGINRGALPTGNAGRNDRGYGLVGGYYPFYLSTFDNSDTPYVYNSSAQDQAAQTAGVTANLLGEQIAQLSAQVDALRNERQADGTPAQRLPYQAPPSMAEDQAPAAAPITLVLRSGKQIQVKSYAVMGQEIWDFSAQPAKRIALSTVDLNASRAATESSGGEFPELR